MSKMKEKFKVLKMKQFSISDRWFPWLLLVVCILAFGLQITKLGFYFDDWQVIYLANTRGTDAFWDFYQYDRPISAWTYILEVPLLGTTPLYWHVLTLILRWLTAWGMYAVLKRIWPQAGSYTFWMAAIFAVYPSFLQQPIAVAYSQHFATYALYFLSLWLMVKAIQGNGKYWLLTILGMLTAALHMLTMEYMVGLELIRPAIIWLLLIGSVPATRQRVKQAFINWIPYLLVWLGFITWRLFFVVIPDDPNVPRLLYSLRENPLGGLLALLQEVLQNLLHVWVSAWYQALEPTLIDFSYRFGIFSWGIALIVTIGLFILFNAYRHLDRNEQIKWQSQAILLGVYATVVGLFPVWFTGRDMFKGMYADRFTLPAMFGASVLLVGLVGLVASKRSVRYGLLALMVGLAIATHLRTSNDYRWEWVQQNRFYQQMLLRAPGIKQNTAIISDGGLSQYVNRYVATFALNTLYDHPLKDQTPSMWYFEFWFRGFHLRLPQIMSGAEIKGALRNLEFRGSATESLIIYHKEADQCIWFLSSRDVHNSEIPEAMRQLAELADYTRIETAPSATQKWPENIFDLEDERSSWCYFYQKAGLAQQIGNWDEVIDLWKQAQKGNYAPKYGYEMLPFIEAYAMQQNWEQAARLTLEAYKKSKKAQSMLCATWDQYLNVDDTNALAYKLEVNTDLGCGQ